MSQIVEVHIFISLEHVCLPRDSCIYLRTSLYLLNQHDTHGSNICSLHFTPQKKLSCCCFWYICFCIHWFQQLDSVCGVFCLIRTSNIMQLLRDQHHLAPPSSEVLFQLCTVPVRSPWGTIITRSLLRGWILALQEPSTNFRILIDLTYSFGSWVQQEIWDRSRTLVVLNF